MKKHISTLVLCLCFVAGSFAQDIHLSQIHASPTLLNPAMNGLIQQDVRLIGNYRGQWDNFTNGYRTMTTNLDAKIKIFSNRSAIAGGLNFMADKAGDLQFTNTTSGFSIAVLQALDWRGSSFLSVGINNSMVSNRINLLQIQAFDKDPLLTDVASNQQTHWDLNTGFAWFQSFGKDSHFNIGAAMFHINRPNVSFFNQDSGYGAIYQDPRYVLHGTADIRLSRVSRLKPNFIYMQQGPHQEITMGSFFQLREDRGTSEQRPTAVYFGAWGRWYLDSERQGADALIFAIRLDYRNTTLGFSFDTNISSLSRASWGYGGIEFSVIQLFEVQRKKKSNYKFKCPET